MATDPRVETDDILMIIDTEVTDATPFITVAHLLVEQILANSGLSEEHLTEIERWLTAHFISVRDPRATEEQMGDARVRYYTGGMIYSNASRDVAGLNETPYGKQVLVLDTTGLLSNSLGKKKASFEVLNGDV